MPGPILLLTRPEAASRRFAAQLGLDVETVMAPLLQIVDVVGWIAPIALKGIILTSENGAIAAGRMPGLPRRAFCVGDRTAETAQNAGFEPISAKGDADALVEMILSGREPGPMLHIRGEHARGDIVGRLNAAGTDATEVIAYRQIELQLSPEAIAILDGERPVILPLFSPRSVTILAEHGPFRARLHVICLSAAVAERVNLLGPRTSDIADSPDGPAMAVAVRRRFYGLTNG